jgi:hypothetical protein
MVFGQTKPENSKWNITGKVIEKSTNLPLEYSTITIKNTTNSASVFGGITNNKGEFSVQVPKGTYDIVIEFISFQPFQINSKTITQNTNLGTISLSEGAEQLKEVVVRAEKLQSK